MYYRKKKNSLLFAENENERNSCALFFVSSNLKININYTIEKKQKTDMKKYISDCNAVVFLVIMMTKIIFIRGEKTSHLIFSLSLFFFKNRPTCFAINRST